MFRSIRWRIAIPYVLLIFATMLGLGIYLSGYIEQTYVRDLETHMATQARMIAEVVKTDWPEKANTPEGLDAAARQWAQVLGARVTLISADGVVLGESDENRLQMDNHSSRPEVATALASGQGSAIRFSHTVGYDTLYSAVKTAQGGIVRLAVPLTRVHENVAKLQRVLLGITVLVAILAALLATWIAGYTSRPVQQLTQAAQQMTAGNLTSQTLPTTLDEVGQLTKAFNSMAIQIHSQLDALEIERGKLAAVLNHMTDSVILVDGEGSIQLLNPAAERMYEITSQQALGHSLPASLRYHQVYEFWQQSRSTGMALQASFSFSRRLVVQASALPLEPSLPGSTLLLFQDVSRQQQIEAMRRDFVSNVSHELRTPLAALKVLAETLRDGALDDPPAAHRFLERMEIEVDALTQMVSELLELSRIESGRVSLQLQDVDPCEIIHGVYERLCLQAERAGLHITMDCAENLPPIQADSTRLQQVMINLLHNAIKFTPIGGEVTIGAVLQGEEVVFFVRDTGIGIAPADLARVFERFYKVDRARSSGGTGLGLAIARHTVEAHGGRIWVESELNKGSVFYLTIPRSLTKR